ncbi:GlxA family transcriptional regulator [Thalassobium sp. R2A62]|jgi:transcriptional regulator GlxA family with amidase domain|uniref:GlxA family transcriptional regulator n=1 Tax=Thalassobium sp. R2A62 TaxID=633131 RepID=UPI0001B1D499|nr:transcriptional regulator, AraC family [Thalassobium sp. R2A62]
MNTGKKIKLGFLIFPGFPMACLTSMIEPLRAANEIVGHTAFDWALISETGARVEASARVSFDPDLALDDLETLDQLFLLSGPTSRFENPTSSEGKLRKSARHGMTLGAVSGGVFPLARAGLLSDCTTSVHWCYAAAFDAEFPDLAATDEVMSFSDRRITASGAAAAFDLSLHLIEETLGAGVATEVACWFQHPLVRRQGVAQRVPTMNAASTDDMLPVAVRDAVDMFASHIEDPVNVADVANAIGVSGRQLERMFKKTTGKSPLHYYRALRMKAARQLVLYSNDTMTEIALAVGYASSTTMIANYEEVFGLHPAEDRRKINMFRVQDNGPIPAA